MAHTDSPNRPIKTAVRVFDLVQTVQQLESATFTEIASNVEMAESTLHDYLTTLTHLGYFVNEDGQYSLSLRFLDHGIAARDTFSIYSKSRETLKQLAEESGAAVWLTVEQSGKAVYLAQELGENSIETHERLGKHEFMNCLASGKVMLAFSSDEHVADVVETHGLPQKTPESITSMDELQNELAEIRERGYALNHNETAQGVSAVAAPIVAEDHVRGAVAIAAPHARVENSEYRQRLIELVSTGSNEIELRLAYE
ncbi:IclR family transcriptional regulator [Haloferax sulfurifontis]|uniref:IclR family transcriptional regulator n=1 Tax=Haloferax sulfurifontis TaxID=255616 RepID=A0A830DZW7_9EURY|nr:IclR family transcriptional regulator [Haloferax sulfurifontis]GGC63887.1 IclR family transcriptional regulator [Haloferax sulfurifontis]